ncbi:ankyrin repeat and SAM domain-containing protein 3-like [Nilaparvata lugens]|uniref:ankyrin repeat and SAM domain-containing protein 3-like n=1 Tax=Nilaparvata lugens TaxID=108931 RepID=UPI00193CC8DE|nr:ankyrin repeat and SAM domain-containing protein 3-like [Nilaparvata lugens]
MKRILSYFSPGRADVSPKNITDIGTDDEANDMDVLTACALKDIDLVKSLINRRKNVSRKNKQGWTPLMYASYYGSMQIADQLISAGADKCALNNNGHSAFSLAAMRNYVKIMELVFAVR